VFTGDSDEDNDRALQDSDDDSSAAEYECADDDAGPSCLVQILHGTVQLVNCDGLPIHRTVRFECRHDKFFTR